METNNYIVCVSCMTYNHAPYIEDALNGFCMQQTNFPFVCTIIDDASTDGEQEVIKNYLSKHFDIEDKTIVRNEETDDYTLTFARHKTNLNCFFAVLYLKYNHYKKKNKMPYVAEWRENSKYIALCEGDDYWIDAGKLQKQVSFLETHLDYGLVYTAYRENNNGKLSEIISCDFGSDCLKKYLLHNSGIIATASTMVRYNLYEKREINKNFLMGDVPLWIQLMYASKAHFMNDVTTVYRILAESASHSLSYKKEMMFKKNALEVRMYYAKKYGFTDVEKSLHPRIKRAELLLDIYELNFFHFITACPWKYGITLRTVLHVLKQKIMSIN